MHVVGELPRDIDHVELNLAAVPLLLQEHWRPRGLVPGTFRTIVRGILVQVSVVLWEPKKTGPSELKPAGKWVSGVAEASGSCV